MGTELLGDAIARAHISELDEIHRRVSSLWGAAALSDDQAEALFQAIGERRRSPRPSPMAARRWSVFPPKRRQRSPDREASRLRRRTLASAGPLPPALAARFTEGERAVLYVLSEEVLDHGACDRSIDELAARAGVSRSTAKNALREAEKLALVTVTRRPQKGRKSLTNVVAIVSKEWRLWLERRDRGQSVEPHGQKKNNKALEKGSKGIRRGWTTIAEARKKAPGWRLEKFQGSARL